MHIGCTPDEDVPRRYHVHAARNRASVRDLARYQPSLQHIFRCFQMFSDVFRCLLDYKQPPLSLQILWGQIYAAIDRPKIRLRLHNLDMFNVFPVRLGPFHSNSKYHFHRPVRRVLG